MKLRYPYALVTSAALVLLVYKGIAIAPQRPLDVALGWLLEVSVLSLLAVAWAASQRVRALRVPGSLLFYLLAHAVIVPSLSHTYFFESAAGRHFSLLEVDLRTLAFFFRQVLPVAGALLLAALLLAIHVGAVLLRALSVRAPVVWVTALALSASAACLLRSPPPPSPLGDLVADLRERMAYPQLEIDRRVQPRYLPRMLDRSALPSHGESRYDKLLVFVMETMTSSAVANETPALPAETFLRAGAAHAHRYENYFSTNQDSRTGMLSMLGSRFIPYEAYTEEGRDHYMFLGGRSSLVDALEQRGYRSAFAVSQSEVELVVGDLPWDELIHLEHPEQVASSFLCFVPYEFEHSCEDRALLPRVLDFLDRSPRAFLYQEFVWGHASEYNQASGRTNSDYYSAYIDAVIAHLAKTGALERTLIVLTSDHGFREKDAQRDREMYRIPLWFYAPSLEPSETRALYSHLDFKDLLFQHAFAGAPTPPGNPFVIAIGPTGTSFVALMTDPGQLLLLKARAGLRQLVHAEGYGEHAEATRRGAETLRLYEDYRGYFGQL